MTERRDVLSERDVTEAAIGEGLKESDTPTALHAVLGFVVAKLLATNLLARVGNLP